ncbi:MAG: pyrroline-5-carboxylate reductase [Clostridia bacterium]|nr:pyrroline-5-carboxylate reductase [Clostridia bacterium]
MAEAIISGVIKAGLYEPMEVIASDINEDRLFQVKQKLNICITKDNNEVMEKACIVIIAIKPQNFCDVAHKLISKPNKEQLIISIAAGISLSRLEKHFGSIPVIRVMPNTPALIGAGMAALCKGHFALDCHLEAAEKIFKSVGETVIIDEKLIDGVTGLSGSGPAYVYQFIEALADGGVLVGLPRKTAYLLAAQTVVGAGLMVLKTGLHPGELKDMVTSPGGTTIKAINVLEKSGFRAAVMDAVEAAYLKSKQMGLDGE